MYYEKTSLNMQARFRMCLIANLASLLMMFGSAVLMGYVARTVAGNTSVAAGESWLTYAYLAATRLSLLIGLPAFVISVAGMRTYRLWARQLFSCLMTAWVALVVGFSIFNVDLVWGIAGIFAYSSFLTAGAVLAMSYLTPLAEHFAQPKLHTATSKDAGVALG